AGGLKLSRRLVRGAATSRQREDAFQAGLPVEGKVEREVKGGYEVRVARQRAFCPASQMDIRGAGPVEPGHYNGRVFKFRIVEYKAGRTNIVVSHRVLFEAESQRKHAQL